jgi:hypothetical protein
MNDLTIRLDADGYATIQCAGVISRIQFQEANQVYFDFLSDYKEQFERALWLGPLDFLGSLSKLATRGDE